ncbi:MAG TPA: tripartite tricarboxylate transporter substrate binding protein [Burkholderiales bacterium]|nr:tripartite tricarboxylate transporter substrate binding protein [Burkholderiales bacterium]
MRIRQKLLTAIVAVVLLPSALPSALADPAGYPAKPVRIVTGPSGGGSDVFARPIAQRMHESWGQPVVVENRALGSISAAVAAKSAPDGYTLLVGDRTWQAVATSLYKELPYDPAKDFVGIALIASTPMLIVAHPSVPATSLGEFIAYAKRLPQPLGYATAGIGTASHLPGEQLKQLTGIDLTAVHYKGGGAAMVALLGGEVKVGFNLVIQALPYVKTGRVKAYVITAKKRFPGAADIPTVIEAGFPDLEADYWVGLFAPARTPPSIVAKINRDVVAILQSAAMRASLLNQGAEPVPGTPVEFADFIKSETVKWGRVIKTAGIKPE